MTGAGVLTGGLVAGLVGGGSVSTHSVPVGTINLSPAGREIHLTEAYLTTIEQRPIVAGDSWAQIFCVVDRDDEPIDLTGAVIVMTAKRSAAASQPFFARDTETDLAGVVGAKQIELGDDPTDGTFTVRFSPGDEEILTTIAESPGVEFYDIRIKYADGSVETRALGRIDVMKPLGHNSALP